MKSRTLLSKFTILENNFCGLTSDHLLRSDEECCNEYTQGGAKAEMHQLLQATTHSIREALFHLSGIVDTGDFHTELTENRPVQVELYPSIPKCFKVRLSDFVPPVQISIGYSFGAKGRAQEGSIRGEHQMN